MPTAPPRVPAHPPVRSLEQCGGLARGLFQDRRDGHRGGRGGERAVTETVAQDGGDGVIGLERPEGIAAFELSADRP